LTIVLITFTIYSLIYNNKNNPEYKLSLKSQTLVIVKNERLMLPIYLKVARVLIIGSFFVTFLYFFYNIISKFRLNNIYFDKIKKWTISIFLLVLCMIVLYFPFNFLNDDYRIGYTLSCILYLYVLLIIFYRPNFLNKSSMKISLGDNFKRESEFAVNELDFINEFFTNVYFTNNEISLETMAKKMNVGSNDLYKFIYYKYSMTFNDLVNKNRVDYFIELINNPKYLNFTIDALAKEAGFSSRQHLYKPFKKFHGGNPSDLIETRLE
jgi:AraC-like DNA-binding protein